MPNIELDWVTIVFAIFILSVTFVLHVRFNEKSVSFGPTILTTTGIFATFVGITVGLFHFDTTNIQGSVPSLLHGLQTAFVASALGVFGALTLKYRDYVFGVRVSPGASHEDSKEMTAADMVFQLEEVTRALVGGEDGSLISQLKLLRQDTNDRLDSLKAAQVEALAKLSEMGSKALVEALRDVIKDFNAKISEQFGDNFKELNAAVGQLLVWQRQYKEQIESIVGVLNDASKAMAQATGDYSALVERSGLFVRVAEQLDSMLRTLDDDRTRLHAVSAELATLLVSAQGSLPQIEQKVVALTDTLTTAVNENQQRVSAALVENAAALRTTVQMGNEAMAASHQQQVAQMADLNERTKLQFSVLADNLAASVVNGQERVSTALTENAATLRTAVQMGNDAMAASHKQQVAQMADLVEQTKQQLTALTGQLAESVAEGQERVGAALTDNTAAIRTSLAAANEALVSSHKQHGTQITELVDKTRQQVATLDAALSEELEKSLNSLGRQLTALSERFVQDYEPLTDKLRRLVDSTRGLHVS